MVVSEGKWNVIKRRMNKDILEMKGSNPAKGFVNETCLSSPIHIANELLREFSRYLYSCAAKSLAEDKK